MSESRASGTYQDMRNRAIMLLAKREHSACELHQKLMQRFAQWDERVWAVVLDGLRVDGLQSDRRFTEAYVRMRKRKGYGPTRILHELRERGIAGHMPEVEVWGDQHNWEWEAERVWRQKFGQVPTDYPARAKQMRFLQYRGFGAEHWQGLL